MSLRITAALVALSSTLVFSGSALAADDQAVSKDSMKYGVSFMYGSQPSFSSALGGGFLLGFTMQNTYLEAGMNIGILYQNTDDTSYTVEGLLGFKKSLRSQIIGSVGLSADYMIVNENDTSDGLSNSYRVAPYLGLTYEPKASVQLFVRLMPVSYTSLDTDTHSIAFFQQGQIGMSYFFNA